MIQFRDLLQKSRLFTVIFTLCLAFAISSCSSSGSDDDDDDGGNTGSTPSEATVTSGNKKQVSTASVEGTKEAILSVSNDLPTGVDIDAISTANETLRTMTLELAQQIQNAPNLPTGFSSSVDGSCGGKAYYTANTSGDRLNRIDIDYDDYCSSNIAFNGSVIIYYYYNGDEVTGYKLVYSNLSMVGGGYDEIVNMTITCDANGGCTYSSSTTGSDGRTYTVSGSTVTGNNNSGYNASATITDPDHGTITVTASNITICENGNIGTGEIEVTDSTGNIVLSITFPNCTEMVVVYNGVSATYDQ